MKRFITLLLLFYCTSAIAGDAVIWNGQYGKFLPSLGLRLFDLKEYRSLTVDPTAGAGVVAPIGSVGVRDNAGSGQFWFKASAADTSWTNVLTGLTGWTLTGNAGTNDAVNFLGTTDAQDLVFSTNGTERLRISDAGAYDTTLGFGYVNSSAAGILASNAGTANQVAGIDNAGTAIEFKTVQGTANRLTVTHGVGTITADVNTTLLPSPLAGDANQVLVASGADTASWESIVNANVSAAGVANIDRNKLASGTADHVVINDGAGVMTSEAQLAMSRGGTNKNMTASNGAITYSDADSLELSAVGTAGQVLVSGGAGAPTWTSDPTLANYLYKPGLAGGQTAAGGTAASENLVLRSTTNGTKGQVYLDETTASTSPTTGALRVDGGVGVGGQLSAAGALRSDTSLILSDPGAGTNTVTLQAGVVSGSYSVTLPLAQATGGQQALVNDGAGVTTWQSLTPQLFGSRQTGRSIVAGTGVTAAASHMSTTVHKQLIFVVGAVNGTDVTASPQIEAGTIIGQEMELCGTSDADWVLFETDNNLRLNGQAELRKDMCLTLVWRGTDGTNAAWGEKARTF